MPTLQSLHSFFQLISKHLYVKYHLTLIFYFCKVILDNKITKREESPKRNQKNSSSITIRAC